MDGQLEFSWGDSPELTEIAFVIYCNTQVLSKQASK